MQSDLRLNWLIAIGLVGWLFYLLAPVLTPFIASALLAYIADPVADRLQKLKMPRTLAVVAVFVITFLILALLILLVGPLIKTQVGALFNALPDIARKVEQVWLPTITSWLNLEAGEDVGIGPFLARYSDMVGSWSGKVLLSVSKSGGALAAAVLSLFLIPILTFYLLRDWDSILVHIGALVPESQRKTVFMLARETDEVLSAFLRGQLLVMAALATIYSVGLGLVGLKFAIAIGVVSGLVSFVPYLGFVFGIALAGLTVALEPNPLWQLVGVVVTFSLAQFIEGSVLTPKLVGDRIGLHPVIIIFAVAAGGQLFGFFGILLALPAAAVLSVLVRFAFHRYLKEHPDALVVLEDE
ncbi:MAG: AI-2E family transporter [Gammaproteobacteria bacterium]|nr:AI-2E family transporter [Gammaproteobacteria bacterium]MBU2675663.1 AI-2E family transporter [Gammaproteobacteria bacterium]NNC56538.1 AI-2E family transporter [Woeseiaceae bacterium]NNL49398.1 AI-2E family transporter [Woeseiaceae bacterium]